MLHQAFGNHNIAHLQTIGQGSRRTDKEKVRDAKLLDQQGSRNGGRHLAPFGEGHHATHMSDFAHHKLTVGDFYDGFLRQKSLHFVDFLGHGTQNANISCHNAKFWRQR